MVVATVFRFVSPAMGPTGVRFQSIDRKRGDNTRVALSRLALMTSRPPGIKCVDNTVLLYPTIVLMFFQPF